MTIAPTAELAKPTPPLKYQASFEQPEPDEAETTQKLLETMRKVRETTLKDTGHALRSVHIKSHAIVKGELEVDGDLPPALAQGFFAQPGTYQALMRISATPSDMLPDSVSTPRGCALKIVGVKGDRLPGSEGDVTQDFLMVNHDTVFQVPNAKKFLANFKPLAATTDKAMAIKPAISAVLQGVEKVIEAVGGNSPKIKNLAGEPRKHPLGESFFSQVPVLFGDYMAKIGLIPVSPSLKELTGKPVSIDDDPVALRHAMIDYFANQGGEWDLCAQLCIDLDKMPIEDASVDWPQDLSPYMKVARLKIPPQKAWTEERASLVEDTMAFSPWHGLAAHRPLGSIMRVRKSAYEISAGFRAAPNHTVVQEPENLDHLPE